MSESGSGAGRTRRRVLKGVAATASLYGGVGHVAADDQEPFDEVFGTASSATGEATTQVVYTPEIEEIRSPLAMNPAIHEGRETLRIELDADVDVRDPAVALRPTFGSVRPATHLDVDVVGEAPSELWLDTRETVTVLEAELPPVSRRSASRAKPIRPGLYDVAVAWNDDDGVAVGDGDGDGDGVPDIEDSDDDGDQLTGEFDVQPRALSLRASFPDEPRIYVVSDAHAGDPRALENGFEESAEAGDPGPFLFRFENVVGRGTDRWGSFRRAVAEVSALDPDLVLFPGDFAFGQDAPKKYYQEYADAYAMLSALRAPVYTAVGNHDGYIQGTTDGKQLYHTYIGPWYWSRELREGFRLTCIDSYDWRETDRQGVSYGVSAWGGQARDEQLGRLREVLEAWYDPNRDQTHVSLSHHSPAWSGDPGNPLHDETGGTPVAEQVARGVGDFALHGTAGQSWRGAGRREVRELLASVDTVLHVAGHVHRDGLFRDLDGEIVYTPDGEAELGRYAHEDDADLSGDYTQRELREQLTGGDGTLYVDATTAGSETSQYWGWRVYDVEIGADHVDPSAFGYQPDDPEAFLDDRAVDGDLWPPEHAALGRYSHPTFEFDVERLESHDDEVRVRVANGLEADRTGTLLLAAPFADRPTVEGGELVWRRPDESEGVQDVTVAYAVPAESEQEIAVRPARH